MVRGREGQNKRRKKEREQEGRKEQSKKEEPTSVIHVVRMSARWAGVPAKIPARSWRGRE